MQKQSYTSPAYHSFGQCNIISYSTPAVISSSRKILYGNIFGHSACMHAFVHTVPYEIPYIVQPYYLLLNMLRENKDARQTLLHIIFYMCKDGTLTLIAEVLASFPMICYMTMTLGYLPRFSLVIRFPGKQNMVTYTYCYISCMKVFLPLKYCWL